MIHETLVDLLAIQKEIHPGLFAVMDGSFAGDGPGPRCMVPVVKNYALASGDMVAIDAVAAKMMGFDPLANPFIRMAHEQGLGCGDVRDIEIVGEDISNVSFHFHVEDTLASRGQKMIYWGPLKRLELLLLHTVLAPCSYCLPTRKIVDNIYAQSTCRFIPEPLPPGPEMSSTEYYGVHKAMIDRQSRTRGFPLNAVVSGHKKDVVLTNRLRINPDRQ